MVWAWLSSSSPAPPHMGRPGLGDQNFLATYASLCVQLSVISKRQFILDRMWTCTTSGIQDTLLLWDELYCLISVEKCFFCCFLYKPIVCTSCGFISFFGLETRGGSFLGSVCWQFYCLCLWTQSQPLPSVFVPPISYSRNYGGGWESMERTLGTLTYWRSKLDQEKLMLSFDMCWEHWKKLWFPS